ncbi:MAG: hypothetical protein LBC60_02970 [Spirochaetaceae bacterium]|jgi:hypothetical protein|nr:hypothetical protein [Spirochaetaceae bacterium]
MALKNNEDAAFLLVNSLEMILKITGEVYEIVEAANEDNDDFNGDMFTLCTLAIDNGIIDTVSTLLAITMTSKESKLTLGSDGSVAIEAQTFVNATTATNAEVSSPTPALKQIELVMKVVNIIPDISSFLREVTTTIIGFAEGEENEQEEL